MVDGFIYLTIAVVLYLLPAAVASQRGHPSASGIFLLNLFLGWTVLGWLAALIWAASGNGRAIPGAPTPDTHVRCPDCRELILKEARICKHCGCRLVPSA